MRIAVSLYIVLVGAVYTSMLLGVELTLETWSIVLLCGALLLVPAFVRAVIHTYYE